MLNNNNNENSNKINRSNSQKHKFASAAHFFVQFFTIQDSTFLLFFLSKSLCGHVISCQKHLEFPVVSYLLIDLFYIGMPANGQMVNRTGIHSHHYQNFLDRWITNFS